MYFKRKLTLTGGAKGSSGQQSVRHYSRAVGVMQICHLTICSSKLKKGQASGGRANRSFPCFRRLTTFDSLIVRFLVPLSYDGHGGPVENSVSSCQPEQR